MKTIVATREHEGCLCCSCMEPVKVGEILSFYDADIVGEGTVVSRAVHLLCPSSEIGESQS